MPVRCPPFVHDLAAENWVEIERLFAHGQKDIALPVVKVGRVMGDEPQQIVLRPRRQRSALRAVDPGRLRHRARQASETVLEGIGRRIRCLLDKLGEARAVQRLIDVDMGLEGERCVEHGLDPGLAMGFERTLEPVGACGALLENAAAGHGHEAGKQLVILGKVGVAENMGDDQGIFGQRIVFLHEGLARVAREHDFENARVPHVLAYQLVNVAHAERPVAHPDRQAIDGYFDHEIGGYQVEGDGIKIQAQFERQRFNLRGVVGQGVLMARHGRPLAALACTSRVKNFRSATQTSSGEASTLLPMGLPRRSSS